MLCAFHDRHAARIDMTILYMHIKHEFLQKKKELGSLHPIPHTR